MFGFSHNLTNTAVVKVIYLLTEKTCGCKKPAFLFLSVRFDVSKSSYCELGPLKRLSGLYCYQHVVAFVCVC